MCPEEYMNMLSRLIQLCQLTKQFSHFAAWKDKHLLDMIFAQLQLLVEQIY